MRFSALKILKEGLTGNKGWTPHWRNPEPKAEYDAIIIAVAHNQFKEYGLETLRSWGRDTHVLYDLKYLFEQSETDLRL